MYFRLFFVLNAVRVSNPLRLTYTQKLIEYPPGKLINKVGIVAKRLGTKTTGLH